METERAWKSMTGRSVPVVRDSDGADSRRTTVDEVVLAVCFLAVVGVVLLGGLLMLFTWVTATLPTSPMAVCTELDGCVMPTPNENQPGWTDDLRVDQPRMTP
jgi:hypothetical protein